ncbi:MFS transporter [Xylocopilactobacillus apicola]|uniref:Chloramphenicol resistance protein n=1 Tax=Xylocopilactobacillus apicola TaxID=2932184 RepID=A0AAU9DTK2_9LACO|nr:MFS transporter [Xylocopilactobacillus apicola]BDR58733.1 chloramphenicol resistance protein [Xylocopilactobacillus apicola]
MKSFKIQSVLLVLLSFVLGWSEFIIVGILVDIGTELKVSISVAGLLVTVFSAFYALGTPVITTLIRRNNLYRYLVSLMIILIFGNILAAISTSYFVLLLARIITAVVCGTLISVDLTITNIITPMAKKGKLIAWVFSGFSIASVLGVPLGTWITSISDWRTSFWVIAITTAITLLLLILFLPHDYSDPNEKMHKTVKKGFLRGEMSLLKDQRILLASLIPLFNWAGFYVVYTYFRPILSNWLHFASAWVTIIFLCDGLASLASNQLGGPLAQRDWMHILPWFFALEIIIMCSFPWTLNNKVTGLIALLAMSLLASLINSPIQIYLLEVAEKEYPEAVVFASSLNSIFASLGIAVGSAMGGVVVSNWKLPATGIAGAIFFLITLILVVVLAKVNRKR